jgi:hypothetical protein
MNTGHGGSMGTTHANTPTDALVRLETLAMMAENPMPLTALRRQIAGAVHLVVQAKRLHDGSRKITNIAEVLGVDEHGRYTTQDLFKFVQTGIGEDHKILGEMRPCGVLPTFFEEIEVNGLHFPKEKFGVRAAPKATAPATGTIPGLNPAQMQALQAAAAKAGMTVQQYHQALLAQRAKQAAAKAAGKKSA